MTEEGGWVDAPSDAIATHPAPVWRDRADFLLQVDLSEHGMPGRWEQLWARRVDERRFELCCIPFFAYGMTLGDVVETAAGAEHVPRVVRAGGRRLVRAAFLASTPAQLHETVHGALTELGVPNEWRSHGYLACSPTGEAELSGVLRLLEPYRACGMLRLEQDPVPDGA